MTISADVLMSLFVHKTKLVKNKSRHLAKKIKVYERLVYFRLKTKNYT
jgi:hypothetical protein